MDPNTMTFLFCHCILLESCTNGNLDLDDTWRNIFVSDQDLRFLGNGPGENAADQISRPRKTWIWAIPSLPLDLTKKTGLMVGRCGEWLVEGFMFKPMLVMKCTDWYSDWLQTWFMLHVFLFSFQSSKVVKPSEAKRIFTCLSSVAKSLVFRSLIKDSNHGEIHVCLVRHLRPFGFSDPNSLSIPIIAIKFMFELDSILW